MHVEVMRVIKNALPDPSSEEARIIAHTARERPHRDFLHVRKVIDDVEKPLAKTHVAFSLPYTFSRPPSHPPPRHPQPETIEAHASVQMRFSESGCSFAWAGRWMCSAPFLSRLYDTCVLGTRGVQTARAAPGDAEDTRLDITS